MLANELKASLLSEATTEQQQQFAEMLAKECAKEDLRKSGHKCWFFVPTPAEYAIMEKYAKDGKCPKCRKGRVVVEIFKCYLTGDNLWLKCYFGEPGCDFKESAFDENKI